MKALKYFGMLIAALFVSFAFVACDKDEVDDLDDLENLNVKVTTNIDKQSSKTVGTAKAKGFFEYVITATYKSDVCTSFVMTVKCETDAITDLMWEGMIEDEDPATVRKNFKRDGKTITMDMTDDLGGMPREFADAAVALMLREIESAYSDATSGVAPRMPRF